MEKYKQSKRNYNSDETFVQISKELHQKVKEYCKLNRSSAQGGNNSELKSEQSKGVEILILNYNPETGERI